MRSAASSRPSRLAIAALAVFGLVAASCGSDDDDAASTTAPVVTDAPPATDAPPPTDPPPATDPPTTTEPAVSGEVVVFAAASLTDAFTELGEAFTEASPDASVTFNFAGSSDLVAQILEGAPADVFASADLNNMTKLTDAEANGTEPVVFAHNLAEIIVEPGNPHGITGVESLEDDDLILVICAPEVPCGSYALQVFENAGVTVNPDSLEENVRAVVSKVTMGEADAGISYATDVIAAGDGAEGVEIPDDVNVVAEYPIAITLEAPNAEAAQAFIDFVLSAAGQEILASYGFTSP